MTEAEAEIVIKAKECPFCGGLVDTTNWLGHGKEGKDIRGPECEQCGATAPDMETWNSRLLAIPPHALGTMTPLQAFEHHIHNPNLFRTLARRLSEFATYIKVSCRESQTPIEEGSIGPDCALATLLLIAMADIAEEQKEDEDDA